MKEDPHVGISWFRSRSVSYLEHTLSLWCVVSVFAVHSMQPWEEERRQAKTKYKGDGRKLSVLVCVYFWLGRSLPRHLGFLWVQ